MTESLPSLLVVYHVTAQLGMVCSRIHCVSKMIPGMFSFMYNLSSSHDWNVILHCLAKRETRKPHVFTQTVYVVLLKDTQKHIEIITNLQLNLPLFAERSTVYAPCLFYTHTLAIRQRSSLLWMSSDAVSRMEVVLWRAWNESQWPLLMGCNLNKF